MENINRRQFLGKLIKTGAGVVATSLYPTITLAKQSYKTNDFSEDSNQILLARMIFGEARDLFKIQKDYREPAMIGFTALNRANDKIKGNGTTLKQSILKNKVKKVNEKYISIHQYSCFNSWDPNLKKLKNPEKYNSQAWEKSLTTSRRILEGKLTHLNYGQDHYHLKNMKKYPSWTKSSRMKKVWGQPFFKHSFYEDIKA